MPIGGLPPHAAKASQTVLVEELSVARGLIDSPSKA